MPVQVPELQQFQMPNVAAKFMQFKQFGNQQKLMEEQQNAAVAQQQLAQKQQEEIKRKIDIETKDFALNIMAGVNSAEDLDIAKGIFNARYPQHAEMTEKIMSDYSPQKVEMIRNSLRTETQRLKGEEIKGFGAGTALYKEGEKVGQVPFAPSKENFEVFENTAGNQVYVEKGNPIPEGYKKVMAKGTQINVNTGDLGKTTKAKLEKDIIEGTQNIQSFTKTRELFKPEYLTIFGKGGKVIAEVADKVGVSTKDQKGLIRKRSKWFRQAKADFIAYRKWATGVAGGEKELAEIATSFPDPVKNSPTQYQANLDGIEETTKRILSLNKDFLQSGIDLKQPLEKVLEQARGVGVAVPTPGGGGGEVIIHYDAQGNRIQ